jgi:hypothetical protein
MNSGFMPLGSIAGASTSKEVFAFRILLRKGEIVRSVKYVLQTGYEANGKTFKVRLDGYNQTDLFSGNVLGARKEFFYFTDDGDLAGFTLRQMEDGPPRSGSPRL